MQGSDRSGLAPVEDALTRQNATLKGQAATVENGRSVLRKCKVRLDIDMMPEE